MGATNCEKLLIFLPFEHAPDFYKHIVDNDKEFSKAIISKKMSWLKTENEDLYDPS